MPDGRDGGRGDKPSRRATASRNAWLAVRSVMIAACYAVIFSQGGVVSLKPPDLADQHIDEHTQLGKREAPISGVSEDGI